MQMRAVRLILLALLLVTGLGAAYLTWDVHTRGRAALDADRAVDARLDRLAAATAALGAAQQAYVAPGQQRGDALTRASVLVQQIYDDTAALRVEASAPESAASILAYGGAMDALVNVDDRAREHLRLEQELMAADLVYTEARQALDTMRGHLDAIGTAERRVAEDARTTLAAREVSVLGGVAALWTIALIVVIQIATRRRAAAGPQAEASAAAAAEDDASAAPAHVDLMAAAKVCSEISRLSNATAMTPALARAARVIDASGMIVWLGAGDELLPATAYGYGPRTLARFGPITRASQNPTATAWRTAEMAFIPGSPGANGAIVAPLTGHSGCFGVLAVEVRHGREQDEATRAVAAMFAAQLSAVVAPWPAASESAQPAEHPAAPQHTAASA